MGVTLLLPQWTELHFGCDQQLPMAMFRAVVRDVFAVKTACLDSYSPAPEIKFSGAITGM